METTNIYHYQDLSISYNRVGMTNEQPLLILHGWGSNKQVMMPLAKQLADIRDCYVLDLPGFGNSSVPYDPWDVDDYVDLIKQFIEDQNLAQTDLLVHSFGGRIALKLCARRNAKELIGKVLITGGAGMKPKRNLSYYLKTYTANLLKAVQTVTEYLEPTLPKIPHEMLLVWGRNDDAAPLYQAERMGNGIEHAALVVIDHAGHYAFLDRPSHFASIAKAFFEE